MAAKSPESTAGFEPPTWADSNGEPLTCREKIKILNENLAEIQDLAQDALEDAVLMGCDERQVRETLNAMLTALVNPYRKSDRET